MMSAVQLRRAGQLPLNELRLESQAFRKASAVTHATPSHIDDRGVRALVDSICQRWRIDQGACASSCTYCPVGSGHLTTAPATHKTCTVLPGYACPCAGV